MEKPEPYQECNLTMDTSDPGHAIVVKQNNRWILTLHLKHTKQLRDWLTQWINWQEQL